jgi:UDPglucose 6-dehydrogenase
MAKISIIGSGIVGMIVGKGFKKLGNEVIFYDIDEKKVKALQDSGLNATVDLEDAIRKSEISFISVPTPSKNGKIDLSYIKSAVGELARCLKKKDAYHTVVVKSTVVPNTTEKIIIPLLEKNSGKKVGVDIGVCMNPEFLTEIEHSWTNEPLWTRDFFTEERIVIGESDKKSGATVEALYKPLKVPIIRTDLKTAELIKYACNCALASRISYWNEIYYICQKLGIDSDLVARVAAMDKRIGKYGTIHGKAFGGKCFPKDLEAFIGFAKSLGYEPVLLEAVEEINKRICADRGVRE